MDRQSLGNIKIFNRRIMASRHSSFTMNRTLALGFVISLLLHAALLFLIPAGTASPPRTAGDMLVLFTSPDSSARDPAAAVISRPAILSRTLPVELPTAERVMDDQSAVPAATTTSATTNAAAGDDRLSVGAPPPGNNADTAARTRYNSARSVFVRLLEERKAYPLRARDKGIEGEVGLSVTLDAAGRAEQLAVNLSSGSSLLDNAALDLVRRSLPFAHGLGTRFSTTITIAYRLAEPKGF